ncbi:DNA-processing protein DprA [Chitinophaga vietnamensis]|uniref:DNA-processing protein DprA n=1 Tax=Chitinophaga vietnamensis TaxID=2593957 RepID=UPI001177970D|nr:DNA-processing protein DprA [Chitinophaga vietnamensis]
MPPELKYQLALTLIPQIGDVTIKKLLEHYNSAAAIFHASQRELERIETVGTVRAAAIKRFRDFGSVEREMDFIERYKIRPLFYTDEDYPARLRQCYDSPPMLYYKGFASLNVPRIVNIVGTRQPSAYGRMLCEQLVTALVAADVTVVSGLAYGIDIVAHRTAVSLQAATIGVLAHGLDRIYPYAHRHTATQMLEHGGLLTDFPSNTAPDRQNFPKRNRIVAGLCDATIVVESGIRGGSLITADLANGYHRDVFCFPGRVHDWHAAGCHHLIKNNKAMLVTDAADILSAMGWADKPKPAPTVQRELFVQLSEEERQIMTLFEQKPRLHLEELYVQSRLSGSQIATAVFNLEMQSLLKSLPGGMYVLADR